MSSPEGATNAPQPLTWDASLSAPINKKEQHFSPDQDSGFLRVSDGGFHTCSFNYDTESRMLGLRKGAMPSADDITAAETKNRDIVGSLRNVSLLTPKYTPEQRKQLHNMSKLVKEQLRYNKLGIWLSDYGWGLLKGKECIQHNIEVEKLRQEISQIDLNSEKTFKECQKAIDIGFSQVTGTIGRSHTNEASMAVVAEEVDEALKLVEKEGASPEKMKMIRGFARHLKIDANRMAELATFDKGVKIPKGKEGNEARKQLKTLQSDCKRLRKLCPPMAQKVRKKELTDLIILMDSIMNNGKLLGEFVIKELGKIKDEDDRVKLISSKKHFLSKMIAELPDAYEYIFNITNMKGVNAEKLDAHGKDRPLNWQEQQIRDSVESKESSWPKIYKAYCNSVCELIGGKERLPSGIARSFKVLDVEPIEEGDAGNETPPIEVEKKTKKRENKEKEEKTALPEIEKEESVKSDSLELDVPPASALPPPPNEETPLTGDGKKPGFFPLVEPEDEIHE